MGNNIAKALYKDSNKTPCLDIDIGRQDMDTWIAFNRVLEKKKITLLRVTNRTGLRETPVYFLAACSSLVSVDCSSPDLHAVNKLAEGFLFKCVRLNSILLSGLTNVVKIDNYVLFECTSLNSFDGSGLCNVKTIGSYFLSKCKDLRAFETASLTNVTSIGDNFLSNCVNLVTFDAGGLTKLTSLPDYFCCGNSSLASFDTRGLTSVIAIGHYVFFGCVNLTSFSATGLRNVVTIGNYFLSGCTGLSAFCSSGLLKVTTIGSSLLSECNGLKSFESSGLRNVTSLGENALLTCTNLATFDASGLVSLTSLPSHFLFGCIGLTSFDAAGLVKVLAIGHYVLSGCVNLTIFNTTGLRNVSTIGDYFLSGCCRLFCLDTSGLGCVTMIGTNFLSKCTQLVSVDTSGLSRVTTIGDFFLVECTGLVTFDTTPLTLVVSIATGFLSGCTGLTSVNTSGLRSVRSIGRAFLCNCTSLVAFDTANLGCVAAVDGYFLAGCHGLTVFDARGLTALSAIGVAFVNECWKLESVVLAEGLPKILVDLCQQNFKCCRYASSLAPTKGSLKNEPKADEGPTAYPDSQQHEQQIAGRQELPLPVYPIGSPAYPLGATVYASPIVESAQSVPSPRVPMYPGSVPKDTEERRSRQEAFDVLTRSLQAGDDTLEAVEANMMDLVKKKPDCAAVAGVVLSKLRSGDGISLWQTMPVASSTITVDGDSPLGGLASSMIMSSAALAVTSVLRSLAVPPVSIVVCALHEIVRRIRDIDRCKASARQLSIRLVALEPLLLPLGSSMFIRNAERVVGQLNPILHTASQLIDRVTSKPAKKDASYFTRFVAWAKATAAQLSTNVEEFEEIQRQVDRFLQDLQTACLLDQSRFMPARSSVQKTDLADAQRELQMALTEVVREASREGREEVVSQLQAISSSLAAKLDALHADIHAVQEATESVAASVKKLLRRHDLSALSIASDLVRFVPTTSDAAGPLGSGGQGTVELVEYQGTKVAAKRAHSPAAQQQPQDIDGVEEALHEAKILFATRHPHIVQCFGVCVKDGTAYVLMELCTINLRELLQREGKLPVPRAADLCAQVSAALLYIHTHPVLGRCHLDVKPENVMLGADGKCRLIDLGSSRRIQSLGRSVSQSIAVGGGGREGLKITPAYCAHEILNCADPAKISDVISPKCDVFSLGVLLLQLLTDELPSAATELDASWPPQLRQMIKQCLAKKPDSRPTMQQMHDTLRDLSLCGNSSSSSLPMLDATGVSSMPLLEQQQGSPASDSSSGVRTSPAFVRIQSMSPAQLVAHLQSVSTHTDIMAFVNANKLSGADLADPEVVAEAAKQLRPIQMKQLRNLVARMSDPLAE